MALRAYGALFFVLGFFLFSQLSATGLPSRDAGELTTAAVLLGVPHETGFPLYCLLVKGASLLPIGEIAWRANLVSAACGALAASCLALLVRAALASVGAAAGIGIVAGGAAAALFCATGVVFHASIAAEVYAPTTAALALGLRCFQRTMVDRADRADRHGGEGDRRAGLLLFFLVGLSLSLHTSLRLLCVPAAIFTLRQVGQAGRASPAKSLRAVAAFAGLALLGLGAPLLIVAYLPLRAGHGDLGQFGDPGDLTGLLRHLSAARIRAAFADRILTRDLAVLGKDLREFCGLIVGQVGTPALLLAAIGLGRLCSRAASRPMALCLASLILGDSLYAAWINPMGIADWQVGTPTALALTALTGVGVGAAALRAGRGPWPWVMAVALALIAVLPAAVRDAPIKLGGRAAGASRFARRALAKVPPRGLLLPISDDLAAAARYEQGVAGERPDVAVVVRQLAWDPTYLSRAIPDPGWLSPADLAAFARMPEGQRARAAPALLGHVVSRAPARVAWEPHPSDPPPRGLLAWPDVPVFTLQDGRPGWSLPDPAGLTGEVAALLAEPRDWAGDPLLRAWGARTLVRAAEPYLLAGDSRAAPLIDHALRLAPGFDSAWIAAGVLRAQAGDLRGALDAVGQVLARDPAHPVATRNAALYRRRLRGEPAPERRGALSPGPR
jgi:hypothetical protein